MVARTSVFFLLAIFWTQVFCEVEECPKGKWGLSCSEECEQECESCDKISGKCNVQVAESLLACSGPNCLKECEENCEICDQNTGKCQQSNSEGEASAILGHGWTVALWVSGLLTIGAVAATALTIILHKKTKAEPKFSQLEDGEQMLDYAEENMLRVEVPGTSAR